MNKDGFYAVICDVLIDGQRAYLCAIYRIALLIARYLGMQVVNA